MLYGRKLRALACLLTMVISASPSQPHLLSSIIQHTYKHCKHSLGICKSKHSNVRKCKRARFACEQIRACLCCCSFVFHGLAFMGRRPKAHARKSNESNSTQSNFEYESRVATKKEEVKLPLQICVNHACALVLCVRLHCQ